jgi:hypothetical protein
MNQQTNSKLLVQLRNVINEKAEFPIGTLVYFGPDNSIVTKIVAVVIQSKDSNPILKSWSGPGIISSQTNVLEIGQFFMENQVENIIMTNGIVGCPHDEGVDYPAGEECPYCPFWSENST